MADIVLDQQSAPSSPSAGQSNLFVDSTTKELVTRDSSGFHRGHVKNQSTGTQSPTASTRTYITGSSIAVPSNKLQAGTCFRWKVAITKTAAGTATSTIDIAVGTAGTTADTARVSFTKPAGTAAADEGVFKVMATVRSVGAAGVMVGEFVLMHNGNTAGLATIPVVVLLTTSAGFDMTVANLIVGLCITTGASEAVTITQCQAEAWNL